MSRPTFHSYRMMIAGVDRTAWVEPGIQRSMQMGNGSRAALQFSINNSPGAYAPAVDDDVILYEDAEVFFAGSVESVASEDYSGTRGLQKQKVTCTDYGMLLDRRIIGLHLEPWNGGIVYVTLGAILGKISDTGITLGAFSDPGVSLGVQNFNWVTASQAINQALSPAGWDYRVDWSKVLWAFPKSTGYAAAPFSIGNNDDNWASIVVTKSRSQRANRVGVRNAQDIEWLWTDTVTAIAGQQIVPTSSVLQMRPEIVVNGTQESVADFGDFSKQWYWLSSSVVRNSGLTAGDVVEIKFPSPLSYVAWAQDATDIAAHGEFEVIYEVKDVRDAATMQTIANGLLARYLLTPVGLEIVTYRSGLEPGQLLTVNTTRPNVNGTFLINSVSSQEDDSPIAGKKFFRHTVLASNAQLRSTSNVTALIQRSSSLLVQAKKRDGTYFLDTTDGPQTVQLVDSASLPNDVMVFEKLSRVPNSNPATIIPAPGQSFPGGAVAIVLLNEGDIVSLKSNG